VIVGAYYAFVSNLLYNGYADIYSGPSGALIHRIAGENNSDQMGRSVARAGDVNNDGLDDVFVSAFSTDVGGMGSVGSAYLIGFNPYISATANSLSAYSNSLVGIQLDFPPEAAFYQYRLLVSASGAGPYFFGVEIPLTLDSFALDSYFGSYPFPMTSNMQGTLDANGMAFPVFGVPQGYLASGIGYTLTFAAIANPPAQGPAFSSVAIAMPIIP